MTEKTAAFRQRRAADTARWRERLANGRACYTIEVDGSTFDLLEQLGWLPRRTDDRRAVAVATSRPLTEIRAGQARDGTLSIPCASGGRAD